MVTEIKTTAKLRQWGNSYGIVIPIEEIRRAGLSEGAELEVTIRRRNVLRELYGSIKLKTPTSKLLKMVDKEIDPDLVKKR